MIKISTVLTAFVFFLLTGCHSKTQADLLVANGTIYTVDSAFTTVSSMIITDGKVVATGTADSLLQLYAPDTTIDASGKFIYPGFIDAHCHFLGYGRGLNNCNLTGTTSWQAILDTLQSFASTHPGGWLIGRGWDQNDWDNRSFPDNSKLNELFPDRPVFLTRIDGHAAIANKTALDLAGLKTPRKISGGEIMVNNGQLTGVLIDNAVSLVASKIPEPDETETTRWLLDAQRNCFAGGLTSVHDCGLDAQVIPVIEKLQAENALQMRMYVMLSDKPANYQWAVENGKIKTEKLNVSAFKLYADGALGSRGACLLQSYNDRPGKFGFLLKPKVYFDSILPLIADLGWQACTHAIGDSANRVILNLYASTNKRQSDSRWRIEHAQVINEKDFDLFGKYNIVPSVQPTHATSDMYWAKERIGADREQGAYAYQRLLKQNGWLPLGTDFPVEEIYPLKTFYASVARKDGKGFPANGYYPQQALTREETLRGMTIWAAKAAFEEKEKGSLEKGKYADFVMLDKDLMSTPEDQLLNINVLMTVSGGKIVSVK